MSHPLPAPIAELLRFTNRDWLNLGNRSLLFDRGMDRYDRDKIPPGGKEAFLNDFKREFQASPPADFGEVRARRKQALQALQARCVETRTRTRLVVGLGLPHPTETGFLLDRISGSPYLPGSSVKGLLRAAARLAAAGELAVQGEEWTGEDVRRIFGPELGGGETPRTGSVVFYDAFPVAWPRLEVDILTPHHRGHNDNKETPASDWDEPNPVPFLTLAPGTPFQFFLGPGDRTTFDTDFPRLRELLQTALDLLGIGAKKSSGYGIFGEEAPAMSAQRSVRPPVGPPPAPSSPSRSSTKEISWTNVELGWHQGSPAAFRGSKDVATCAQDLLDPALLKDLRQHNRRGDFRGDVVVVKISGGGGFRLDRVSQWRRK